MLIAQNFLLKFLYQLIYMNYQYFISELFKFIFY